MSPSPGATSTALAPLGGDESTSPAHGALPSPATGMVTPHDGSEADEAATAPPPAAEEPLLPVDVQRFLERYPQPAFALRASTLFETLVAPYTRATESRHGESGSLQGEGAGVEEGGDGGGFGGERSQQQQSGDHVGLGVHHRPQKRTEQRLTSRQQEEGVITAEERRERAEDARELAQRLQQAETGFESSSKRTLPPGLAPASQPPDPSTSGPNPRAHARGVRILEEAFSADEPAHTASIIPLGAQLASGVDKSRLLEGGQQKSHDASRTAEGAFRSFNEQRSALARSARAAGHAAMQSRREQLEFAEEDPVRWARPESVGSQVRWRTTGSALSLHSSAGSPHPSVKGTKEPSTHAAALHLESSSADIRGVSPLAHLHVVLTPVWYNSKWAEIMAPQRGASPGRAQAHPQAKSDETISIFNVLSHSDAQKLVNMLSAVVTPPTTEDASGSSCFAGSLARGSGTILIGLKFPPASTRHAAPASGRPRSQGRGGDGANESFGENAAGVRLTPASKSDDGAFPSGPSRKPILVARPAEQRPPIPSEHRIFQQETQLVLPFLQVVATLWPEDDLVICTTILADVPPSEPSTLDSQIERDVQAAQTDTASVSPARHVPQDVSATEQLPPPTIRTDLRRSAQASQAHAHSHSDTQGASGNSANTGLPEFPSLAAAVLDAPQGSSAELPATGAEPKSSIASSPLAPAATGEPASAFAEWRGLFGAAEVPMQDFEEEDERRAAMRRLSRSTSTLVTSRKAAPPSMTRPPLLPSLVESDESRSPEKEGEGEDEVLERLRLGAHTGSTDSLTTTAISGAGASVVDQEGDGDGSSVFTAANSISRRTSTTPTASLMSGPTVSPRSISSVRRPDVVSSLAEQRLLADVELTKPDRERLDGFETCLSMTDCGRTILAVDWRNTSLGDMSVWSPEIRSHVMAILDCPFQLALWLGEDGVLLYNDAYSRLLGSKHPVVMGKCGTEAWAEIPWSSAFEFASMSSVGRSILHHDQSVMVMRDGTLEECYFTWASARLRDGSGRMIGYQHRPFETTARVIAERRLATLRELSEKTLMAQTLEDFASRTLCALEINPHDLPFALLYICETVSATPGERTMGQPSVSAGSTSQASAFGVKASRIGSSRNSHQQRIRLLLHGSIGVPEGHPSAPTKLVCALATDELEPTASSGRWSLSSATTNSGTFPSTASGETSFSTVWPLVEALESRKPVLMNDLGRRVEGFTTRGWPNAVERGVVMPVLVEGAELPRAILIVGLNPLRPFNSPYSVFLNSITRSLSSSLLGVAAYQEQARKARDLAAENDARTAFFASVSHELRTPLTLLLGPLEDVLTSSEMGISKADRDRLEIVRRAGQRLHCMVNTLLDISRLECGKMKCAFRPMQIGSRVHALAELFRLAIERSHIAFTVDLEDDQWADQQSFYVADEMLELMVNNLLGNALKYTASGAIQVRVTYDPSNAYIAVEDTGVGIAEENLEVIFERFHRVEGTARSFEGSGIGLNLVLGLIEACGGDITVKSSLGHGSIFTLRFPRGSQHVPSDMLDEEPFESLGPLPRSARSLAVISDAEAWRFDSAPTEPASLADGSSMVPESSASSTGQTLLSEHLDTSLFALGRTKTVCLVIDDNAEMRAWIGSSLAKNWTVIEAANGKVALDYALSHPVSIIVTDLAMPIMNGRELLRAIRQNPGTQAIPVIFLSAQATSDARIEALQLGADDFMLKPFRADELLARVKLHLQISEIRKELERRVQDRTVALLESERQYKELADRYRTLSQVSPVGIFQTEPSGRFAFANPRFYEISGHLETSQRETWRQNVRTEYAEKVGRFWDDAMSRWQPDRDVVTTELRFKNGNWVQLELRAFEKGYIGSITDISHQKEVEALQLQEVETRAQNAEETRRSTDAFLDMASHELRNPLSGMWQNAEVVSASLKSLSKWLDRSIKKGMFDSSVVDEMRQELIENIEGVESIRVCADHQKRIADDIINVSKLNMGLLSIELAPFNFEGVLREVVKSFEATARDRHIALSLTRNASLDRLGIGVVVADAGRIRQLAYNFISNALKYGVRPSGGVVTVILDANDAALPPSPTSRRIADPDLSFSPPTGYVWCSVSVEDSGRGLSAEQLDKLFARFSQANPRTDQYGGSGLGLYISRKLMELHRGFIDVESTLGKGSRFTFVFPAKRYKPEPRASGSQIATTPPAGEETKEQVSAAASSCPSSPARLAVDYFAEGQSRVTAQDAVAAIGPIRVLVVEDNLINQKVMTRQLKQQGFEVTVAGDGQQALEILSEDAKKIVEAAEPASEAHSEPYAGVHIVLMDIEMPVMDGLTAVRELRRRERDAEISHRYPVCAVTGNAREAQRLECLNAGFDDVANKPYELVRLLQQMSRLIGIPIQTPR
ncbi:hypothetical protein JCM10908_002618 [Rhodotorula pacifica]|uniref:uncharacterized protein n=1 Tax=Rhodotorula pacifica TaxID=1495444 RepID=UPI00317E6F8D